MCENELCIVQAIHVSARHRSRGLGGMEGLVSLPILFLGEHASRPPLWVHQCILPVVSSVIKRLTMKANVIGQLMDGLSTSAHTLNMPTFSLNQ